MRSVTNAVKDILDLGGLDNVVSNPLKALGGLAAGVMSPIAQVFGAGDYSLVDPTLPTELPFPVTANSIIEPALVDSVPAFGSHEGYVDISHREYLGDILAVSGSSLPAPIWFNQQYVINPTNSACFPWLSTIAPSFEQWKLLGGLFEFKTTSGFTTAGPSTSLASVSMAMRSNVNVRPFTTKREILNHFMSASTVASASVLLPLECLPEYQNNDPRFVYLPQGDLVAGAVNDLRLNDFGIMQMMVSGGPTPPIGGSVLGELWFTYQIRLYKPRLNQRGAFFLDGPPIPLPADLPPEIHIPFVQPCCTDPRILERLDILEHEFEDFTIDEASEAAASAHPLPATVVADEEKH